MEKLYEERGYIENLLNTRFNFFIILFASIIASLFVIENINQLKVVLYCGAVLETLLAFVLFRSEYKLDLIMKELKKENQMAMNIIDDKSKQGIRILPHKHSQRRLIGYVIPLLVVLTLIASSIFSSDLFSFLKAEKNMTISITEIEPEKNNSIIRSENNSIYEKIISIGLNFLSIFISILALIVVFVISHRDQRRQRAIFHLERNLTFEGKLSEWSDAFKFYGIDLEEAKKKGISKEQITFLILSINTLSTIAQYEGKSVEEELLGNKYRGRMFSEKSTRMAWEYARKFFSDKTIDSIDRFIDMNKPKDNT